MYGQQIGRIQQPLENVVIEDVNSSERIRQAYISISMNSIPATKPIAKGVADYAKNNPRVGQLLVESLDKELFNFSRTFDDYLDEVDRTPRGKALPYIIYDFMRDVLTPDPDEGEKPITPGLLCAGTNAYVDHEDELWYVLTTHSVVEAFFSISYGKSVFHPLAKEYGNQSLMGYRITGSDTEVQRFIDNLVELAHSEQRNKSILTTSHPAYIREMILDLEFQSHRARNPNN